MLTKLQTITGHHLTRLACLIVLLSARIATGNFSNVTASTAVDLIGRTQVAWGDWNNDGFVDIFAAGGDVENGANAIMLENNQGLNFSEAWSYSTSCYPCNPYGILGDVNNDGWLDIFGFTQGNLFLNQEGNGFSAPQSNANWGIAPLVNGASFGDHDNDGYLDLYVGAYEGPGSNSDVLLRNNQGNGFTNVWTQSPARLSRGITSADFDRDGDIDIYVSNYRLQQNLLFVNGGAGYFANSASARGATGGNSHTIGSAWGDLDNDGEIDLFVGNFSHAGQPGAQFLRNTGSAGGYSFQNMLDWTAGHAEWQESYASPALADYDNDGDLDLFFTTVYGGNQPRLYRNDGNWNFTNVSAAEGLSDIGATYMAAFGDYDNDGDLDLVTRGKLFRNNNNNGNHWLKLKMVGDGDIVNRDAVGAQVRIEAGGQTFMRQVEFGTGHGNQNEPTLHFGLGNIAGPVDLDILWPGGTVTEMASVSVDQLHTVYFARPTEFQWAASSGSWHSPSNWSPSNVPNYNDSMVEFASAASPVTTVQLNSPATVRTITLDGSSSYRLEGGETLNLDAALGTAQLTVTGGNHTWTVPVFSRAWTPGTTTTIDIASGAELTLEGTFDFALQTVTKAGAGHLYLDSDVSTPTGTLQHNEGFLGGEGIVNGDLTLAAATVGPGHGVGELTVKRNFTMGSESVLEIEVGGTSVGQFDTLEVLQNAYLNGTLAVTLTDDYYPDLGQQFPVVQANSVANYGITLGGPDADKFKLAYAMGLLLLESTVTGSSPADYQWTAVSGNWHNSANWSPAGIPNGNNNTAEFAGAASPVTVTMNSPATVREITLDGSSSYQLGGAQTLTLDTNTGSAGLTVTGGNHVWTAPVAAAASTTIDIASGAELTLEGSFDFENQTVTKSGSGRLYLDSATTTQSGTLQHNDGFLGGEGIVNGDLTLAAATVGPGHGVGELTVKGNFTMGSESVLEIEIGGTSVGQFDTLEVLQNAYLNGTLAVTLTDDYYPDLGQQFAVVQANSVANYGITLGGPDADKFKLAFAMGQLLLESTVTGPPVLPGDYNSDGIIDAADFTVWKDNLGLPSSALNGNGSGAATVVQADYLLWKTNFGQFAATGSEGTAAVPEPATLLLAFLAMAAVPLRVRHG